jgi:hypothetical protein
MSLRPQDPAALRFLFPNASPQTEVVIEDNQDGLGPFLIVYTIPDPFPTTPELDTAYEEYLWRLVLTEIAPALTLVVAIFVRCQLSLVPFPAAWQTYYEGLRDIRTQPYPPTIPVQPPIPAGV